MGHIWGTYGPHMGTRFATYGAFFNIWGRYASGSTTYGEPMGHFFKHMGHFANIWGPPETYGASLNAMRPFQLSLFFFLLFTISLSFACLFCLFVQGRDLNRKKVYLERFYMKEKKKKRLLKKEENLSDCSVTVTKSRNRFLPESGVLIWYFYSLSQKWWYRKVQVNPGQILDCERFFFSACQCLIVYTGIFFSTFWFQSLSKTWASVRSHNSHFRKEKNKTSLRCNNRVLRLPAIVLLNTTFARRRRTLLLNVKPARMSVKIS